MSGTVLIVTALEDVTADMVIKALNRRGAPVVRLDPADIGPQLHFSAMIGVGAGPAAWSARLATATRAADFDQIKAVYHRRPSPWRFDHLDDQTRQFAGTEARHGLAALLANLPAERYLSHPAALTHADYKIVQLQVAAGLGFPVPATLVTNDVNAARVFAAEHGPIIYKPFRGLSVGSGERAGAIWAQRVDPASLDESIEVTAHLFQAEVPKTGDVRVTVVGDQLFAWRIASPDRALDWRRGDWDALVHDRIEPPPAVTDRMFSYLKHFGLRFGCFDFALTGDGEDDWWFLECNPNGQWGWLPDCGDIAEAVADELTRGWWTP